MILEVDTEEIKRIVESANHGDWIPFGMVVFCFGLVVFLFIFILRMKEKQMNERHIRTDSNLDKLTEISSEMKTMLAVHDNEIKDLKRA